MMPITVGSGAMAASFPLAASDAEIRSRSLLPAHAYRRSHGNNIAQDAVDHAYDDDARPASEASPHARLPDVEHAFAEARAISSKHHHFDDKANTVPADRHDVGRAMARRIVVSGRRRRRSSLASRFSGDAQAARRDGGAA